MKKLLAFAVVVASFVACNDSTDKTTETTKDTMTVVTPDTSVVVKETTVTTSTDTLKKVDSTKK